MFPLIYNSSEVSPSTPKKVLRKCIVDLRTELDELREFTTLEKQLTYEEEHCYTHVSPIDIYVCVIILVFQFYIRIYIFFYNFASFTRI